jgi:hypothetical protein
MLSEEPRTPCSRCTLRLSLLFFHCFWILHLRKFSVGYWLLIFAVSWLWLGSSRCLTALSTIGGARVFGIPWWARYSRVQLMEKWCSWHSGVFYVYGATETPPRLGMKRYEMGRQSFLPASLMLTW